MSILAWEMGRAIPSAPFRDVIELWTGGRVRANSWPANAHAQVAEQKAEAFKKRTGTGD